MTAPYGPPPAMGRLVVDCSNHPLAFGMLGAKVEINGYPVKVPWGQSPFDLPPGYYLLRVSARWVGEFGAAQLVAAVYPGQVTTVYYRPSTLKWMHGSIGFVPQLRTRGVGAWWAYVAVMSIFMIMMMNLLLR
jgi:hypothetical protein